MQTGNERPIWKCLVSILSPLGHDESQQNESLNFTPLSTPFDPANILSAPTPS